MFVLGINTGLRIGDILPLQVGHTKGSYIDIVALIKYQPKEKRNLKDKPSWM